MIPFHREYLLKWYLINPVFHEYVLSYYSGNVWISSNLINIISNNSIFAKGQILTWVRAQGPGRLPGLFRLTFWPRFHHPRNYQRNQLKKKHLEALGPASCTKFWCASCWHSHLIRSACFWENNPGGFKSLDDHKIHVQKSRGVFFLKSPKRRRQLGHRRTLLGDPETSKKGQLSSHIWQILAMYH